MWGLGISQLGAVAQLLTGRHERWEIHLQSQRDRVELLQADPLAASLQVGECDPRAPCGIGQFFLGELGFLSEITDFAPYKLVDQ